MDITTFFSQKLLPAVTISDSEKALPLAEALLEGGLQVMEITFRTPEAAESIRKIAHALPEMNIGAGTIRTTQQIQKAIDCGARFGLAPGFDGAVVEEANSRSFPFIPGVMTPSEIEQAVNKGCHILKIFPAAPLGGPDFLDSLQGPYADTNIRFLPMGGINAETAPSYCRNSLVLAAGGSWMTPTDLIERGEFRKMRAIVKKSIKSIQVE